MQMTYKLELGHVALPPEIFLHWRSNSCQAVVDIHQRVNERVHHADEKRCHIVQHVHITFCHANQSYSVLHTHRFNGPFSRTTRVSQYQKGKTGLDFTEARDSEWPWHELGRTQVYTLLQTGNHASTPPLSFLQAGCPSCHPTASKHWRYS